jgi:hypothetical protein
MEFLIKQFSPASCRFIPLRSKYSLLFKLIHYRPDVVHVIGIRIAVFMSVSLVSLHLFIYLSINAKAREIRTVEASIC